MDLSLCRTISFAILCVGTVLVLGGTLGTWYFGNRLEAVRPYRQPIRTATATTEAVIISGEDVNTRHIDRGGYIAFYRGTERLLAMVSNECTARQTGKNEVIFRAVFNMDATDSAVGKPVGFLKRATDYVQIRFLPMAKKAKVLGGRAICTFNSDIRVEIAIPAQEITNGLIFAHDLEDVFSKFED